MRKPTLAVCLFAFFFSFQNLNAQEAKGPITGRWLITSDFHGTPIYFKLELTQSGERLTGDFDGDKLEGTVKGNEVYFLAKDDHGGSEEGNAKLSGNSMAGKFVLIYGDNADHPETHDFTATLVPARFAGPAKHHEFVPTTFYRQFSPFNKPVLTINPGDSVHTTTVDAGGTDEKAFRVC